MFLEGDQQQMDNKITTLYKDIISEKFSDANKSLGTLLEEKSIKRIKTVLNNQEDA